VAVKGVLRELDLSFVDADEVPYLEQLTCLTSLRIWTWTSLSSLPEQVVSGLQRLEWGLSRHSSDSSSRATQRLQPCSGSNMRDLQLRGWTWLQDRGAAEAVQRLTALTSLGVHQLTNNACPNVALWRALQPMVHLQQLRRLALPARLLAADAPWLGKLPHLTSMRMSMNWPAPWRVEEAFGSAAASPLVLSNLRSCWDGLKVLEVELTQFYSYSNERSANSEQKIEDAAAGLRALLLQELPGVYVLMERTVMWGGGHGYYRDVEQGAPSQGT
jgi:hypothetical protein